MSLPCRRTTQLILREVCSHPGNLSVAPAETRDSTFLGVVLQQFHSVCIHVECITSTRDQEMTLVRQECTFRINFFHMGALLCSFPTILMSSTYADKNNPCFR